MTAGLASASVLTVYPLRRWTINLFGNGLAVTLEVRAPQALMALTDAIEMAKARHGSSVYFVEHASVSPASDPLN